MTHDPMPDPREAIRLLDRLEARAESRHREYVNENARAAKTERFLELAPEAREMLEDLSRRLFGEVLDEIEANLTRAIREILGQERKVGTSRDVRSGRLQISFFIEQDGHQEDILTGQGGSVLNILSVGLRLVALSTLDTARHRPFLVLDEQDCWLKPELVPRFIGVVKAAADKLGLQVLVISHHQLDHFAFKADTIYGLEPGRDGVSLRRLKGGGQD